MPRPAPSATLAPATTFARRIAVPPRRAAPPRLPETFPEILSACFRPGRLRPLYTLSMPHIDKHPAGAFVWVELGTTDQAAAKAFYGSLFGWEANEMPMGPG